MAGALDCNAPAGEPHRQALLLDFMRPQKRLDQDNNKDRSICDLGKSNEQQHSQNNIKKENAAAFGQKQRPTVFNTGDKSNRQALTQQRQQQQQQWQTKKEKNAAAAFGEKDEVEDAADDDLHHGMHHPDLMLGIPFQQISSDAEPLPLSRTLDATSSPRPKWQACPDLEARHRCSFLERPPQVSDQNGALRNRKLLHLHNSYTLATGKGVMSTTQSPPFPLPLPLHVSHLPSIGHHPRRICRFCHREFPSGRALGGHMRVHGASFLDNQNSTNMMKLQKLRNGASLPPGVTAGNSKKDIQITSNSKELPVSNELSELHKNSSRVWPTAENCCKESLITRRLQKQMKESSECDYNDEFCKVSVFQPKELESNTDEDSKLQASSEEKMNHLLYSVRKPAACRVSAHGDHLTPPDLHRADHACSPERARPCSECGKVFWSWKALFGHMRCHPEREWRGMNFHSTVSGQEVPSSMATRMKTSPNLRNFQEEELRPYAENYSQTPDNFDGLDMVSKASLRHQLSEEDAHLAKERSELVKEREKATSGMRTKDLELSRLPSEQEEEFDCKLEDFLIRKARGQSKRSADSAEFSDDWSPAWPTKRRSKRMRASIQHQSAVNSHEQDNPSPTRDQEDLHDLANCLVLLSAAGNRMQTGRAMESTSAEGSGLSAPTKQQTSYSMPTTNDGHPSDGEQGDETSVEDIKGNIVVASRSNGYYKYECSTCKRCFKSHQALGGHRASHRKIKGCFTRAAEFVDEVHESGGGNIEDNETISSMANSRHELEEAGSQPVPTKQISTVSKKNIKGHGCSICHRIFPTGQALGGHKRCHWNGEKVVDAASAAFSSSKQPYTLQWGNVRNTNFDHRRKMEDAFDLNLPAPVDEEEEACSDTWKLPVCDRRTDTGSTAMDGETITKSLQGCAETRSSHWGVKSYSGCTNWMKDANGDGEAAVWAQPWSNGTVSSQIPQCEDIPRCSFSTPEIR